MPLSLTSPQGVEILIPERLLQLCRDHDIERAQWSLRLPELTERACSELDVTWLSERVMHGYASAVFECELSDGSRACLKICEPKVADRQALALRIWDGGPAVKVRRHIPDLGAILLEWVDGDEMPLDESAPELLAELISFFSTRGLLGERQDLCSLSGERAAKLKRSGEIVSNAPEIYQRLYKISAREWSQIELSAPAQMIHGDLRSEHILKTARGWITIDPMAYAGTLEHELAIAAIKAPWSSLGAIERGVELCELYSERCDGRAPELELTLSLIRAEIPIRLIIQAYKKDLRSTTVRDCALTFPELDLDQLIEHPDINR